LVVVKGERFAPSREYPTQPPNEKFVEGPGSSQKRDEWGTPQWWLVKLASIPQLFTMMEAAIFQLRLGCIDDICRETGSQVIDSTA